MYTIPSQELCILKIFIAKPKLTVRPVINDVWVRIKKRVNATLPPVQLVNGHLGPSGLNVQLHADMAQLLVLANAPVIVKVQTLKCHFEIGY